MKTKCPGNAIYENCVGNRPRYDMGEVEFEKVGRSKDGLVMDVSNDDEDQEDERY